MIKFISLLFLSLSISAGECEHEYSKLALSTLKNAYGSYQDKYKLELKDSSYKEEFSYELYDATITRQNLDIENYQIEINDKHHPTNKAPNLNWVNVKVVPLN
ncbi:hypothetical protein N9O57_00305 [bacterium]|nr:hypothetical protein [bacterium]